MGSVVKSIFEQRIRTVRLERLLPTRAIKATDGCFGKYKTILATIPEVGLIEPLAVYPCRGRSGYYVILDGHLRLKALQELGHADAPCLISTEDDPYTYNDKVSRLSAIQENRMILKAIEQGLGEDEIARALALDVERIRRSVNLLDGVEAYAVERLKDKPITAGAIKLFKKVKEPRQREIADLMVSTGDYSRAYAQALLLATQLDMLVQPDKPKAMRSLKPEIIAQMEKEMENLERDFRVYQDSYGDNALSLSVVQRYMQRLLSNSVVKRFLSKNYPEIAEELNIMSEMELI